MEQRLRRRAPSPRAALALGLLAVLLGCCRSAISQEQQRLEQPADRQRLYFSVSPEDHAVLEGLPVTLRCEATASPGEAAGVEYAWRIDGKPLVPNPRRHLVAGDLRITRVDRMLDSGSFECVARDGGSGASIVSSPAKIDARWISEARVQLQQPKPGSPIRAGAKVELRCHVDGSGDLKYEWFRNTKTIAATERFEMRRNILAIGDARPDDSGVYRCLGRNDAGASAASHGFGLTVPGNGTARLRALPQSVVARRGQPASFGCLFDDADEVSWYFEERGPIVSDDERAVLDNGTLVVLRAQDRDKGFYACHGAKEGAPTQVYAAELQIAYLKNLTEASFEPPLQDQLAFVAEGAELQVSCLTPGGLPTPRLYWRDPQGRIVSDSGEHARVQDGTLILSKARRDLDGGNYTCTAENTAGSTEMTVRVAVTWPPVLKSSPVPTSALEDGRASLSCAYRAPEPPMTRTRWLKDGEPLREAATATAATQPPPRYETIEGPGNSSLVFRSAQPADRGNYSCEVSTRGYPPIRSGRATLAVTERLKFAPEPYDKKFELNSTAKVSCKAQGSTPPTFKWYKNGSEQLPKHVQEINGTLHFSGVLEEDKGNYTCVAVNSQGQINHTIKIDVVVGPRFTVKPENVSALEGSPVLLNCAAEGDPRPTIQWDKDSQMNSLNEVRFQPMANGSLYIKEVYLSDEGKYGCTAGNRGGFRREELHLTVRASDGYRVDMELDAADDGSMMTKTVIITLGAAAAYMVLVVGLMLYCRYRRRRRKQRYLQEQTDGQEKGEAGEVQEEQCELRETSVKSNHSNSKRKENRESRKSDGTDTAHSQTSNHSRRSKSSYDKLAVSRAQLQELKPLGRGEFGEIFSSRYRAPIAGEEGAAAAAAAATIKEIPVMVKVLSNAKDEAAQLEFKRHLDLLHKLNHESIARLVGLCREEEPDYMIIEYTDWGDLKKFLLASRAKEAAGSASGAEAGKPRAPQLAVAQILALANQAARALKHIADHRLVHKDIAARNCLISSNLTLKVSLACMTKEPHQQEYTKHQNHVIPLRWMPKEAVFEDEYSTKSDVYSYACLVWEIFHQGELPFKKLSDDSVLSQLKAQSLAWAPHKAAPPTLQELQNQCWSYDPRERPTFDEIVEKMQEIVTDCSQV